ncbi:hypothetical protein MHBO_002560, partial [Bonamia ostreae]
MFPKDDDSIVQSTPSIVICAESLSRFPSELDGQQESMDDVFGNTCPDTQVAQQLGEQDSSTVSVYSDDDRTSLDQSSDDTLSSVALNRILDAGGDSQTDTLSTMSSQQSSDSVFYVGNALGVDLNGSDCTYAPDDDTLTEKQSPNQSLQNITSNTTSLGGKVTEAMEVAKDVEAIFGALTNILGVTLSTNTSTNDTNIYKCADKSVINGSGDHITGDSIGDDEDIDFEEYECEEEAMNCDQSDKSKTTKRHRNVVNKNRRNRGGKSESTDEDEYKTTSRVKSRSRSRSPNNRDTEKESGRSRSPVRKDVTSTTADQTHDVQDDVNRQIHHVETPELMGEEESVFVAATPKVPTTTLSTDLAVSSATSTSATNTSATNTSTTNTSTTNTPVTIPLSPTASVTIPSSPTAPVVITSSNIPSAAPIIIDPDLLKMVTDSSSTQESNATPLIGTPIFTPSATSEDVIMNGENIETNKRPLDGDADDSNDVKVRKMKDNDESPPIKRPNQQSHAPIQPLPATAQQSHASTQPLPATVQQSHASTQPLPATAQQSHASTQPLPATVQQSHASTQPLPATAQQSHA